MEISFDGKALCLVRYQNASIDSLYKTLLPFSLYCNNHTDYFSNLPATHTDLWKDALCELITPFDRSNMWGLMLIL